MRKKSTSARFDEDTPISQSDIKSDKLVLRKQDTNGVMLKPYESLSALIKPYPELSFAELPELMRNQICSAFVFKIHGWDTLTGLQRDCLAKQYDIQRDPAKDAENEYYWFNESLEALDWWNLPSLKFLHAAMLLVRLNPNDITKENAELTTTDETTPQDFKRLFNAFEALEKVNPQNRALADWLHYAKVEKLKTHSWITRWKAFHEQIEPDALRPPPDAGATANIHVDMELKRQAILDKNSFRGCKRFIIESWKDIESVHGKTADGTKVLRMLKRNYKEENFVLKTVQNHLIELRKQKLIP
jgi:hypothetical protein